MFCSNCGKELEAGDLFCGYCGARLEPVPEPIVEEPAAENVTPVVEEPVQPTQERPAETSSYEERKSPVGWIVAGIAILVIFLVFSFADTSPSYTTSTSQTRTEYYNQLLWTGKNSHIPQLAQKVNSTGTYKAEYEGNKLVRISWKQGNESKTWVINDAGTLERSYQEGTEFCRERKVHAAAEIYDGAGNLIKRSYYGTDGGLKETSSGFAIVEFKYDGVGNEIRREYYGRNRLLKANTDGVAAIEWDYNSAGKEIANRSYDVNGKLLSKTPQKEAAKKVKSNSPSPDRTEYYNQLLLTGKNHHIPQLAQKVNSTGAYKAEYEGNKLVRISCERGNESFTWKINDAGTLEEYYQEGTEFCREQKVHAIKVIHDGVGNMTRLEHYGVDGRLKEDRDGIAIYESEYDGAGNQTRKEFYGVDGHLKEDIDGVAIYEYEYDGAGNQTRRAFYGVDGRLKEIYGVAIFEFEYDSSGKAIAYRGYNAKGDFLGYAELE
ncbi:MAG: zinc ribbon domain-containing protein [Spirochaetaceae bacterium]|nr:zinc ribbon domain-containing protein [Spirochaetaceae bacterium]